MKGWGESQPSLYVCGMKKILGMGSCPEKTERSVHGSLDARKESPVEGRHDVKPGMGHAHPADLNKC